MKGPRRFVTAEWCKVVDDELKDRDLNRAWLAKQLGVAKPIVSRLLNMTHKSSPYVDAICELLGVPPPEFFDARDAEVVTNLRLLRKEWPSEYDRIAANIARALKTPRERKMG